MAELTASLKVRLDEDTRAELEELAARTDRPASSHARRAIRDYLARQRERTQEEPHGSDHQ